MAVETRRLHVSGLTPQISSTDLKARFSTFGNVKALDGLGKLDALGQPRPYAYVTLETTKLQLAKCLNLLSGTTWKGAKLRIGEAKPDFRERIRKENEAVDDNTRPTKRRRLARGTQGVHASDMSPVTLSSLRSGWRTTPLGRLVRPMRMRPLRPLPAPIVSGAQKLAAYKEKKRRKKEAILVRARRRRIDPEDWGSSYLSGVMLDSGSGIVLPERAVKTKEAREAQSEGATNAPVSIPDVQHPQSSSPIPSPTPPITVPSVARVVSKEFRSTKLQPETDLAQEAARSLTFLTSLFEATGKGDGPDANDEDWGGAESLSDLEMDAEPPATTAVTLEGVDDGIEYVPHEIPRKEPEVKAKRASGPEEEESVEARPDETPAKDVTEPQPQAKVQMTKLKDMFAPRAEDAGFSILGNLDLDLELDEALPTTSAPVPVSVPQASDSAFHPFLSVASVPASRQTTFTLDPTRPFFFPHLLTSRSSLNARPGAPLDLFSKMPDFHRTEDSDAIRARWEARKVELTRDWKRRHREAVKSARRRGGTQD